MTTTMDMTPAFPTRPGGGKRGRSIDLVTNFFQIKAIPTHDVYHYDVQITPSGLPKTVNRAIMDELFDRFAEEWFSGVRPAYDGEASFYMPKEMPFEVKIEKLKLEDRRDEFSIKIEKATTISMAGMREYLLGEKNAQVPHVCIQALDVVLKTTPAVTSIMIGASFFSGDDTAPMGRGGAEIWRGYYQSLRPAHGRLLVNLDTAASCFYIGQSVLQLIGEELDCRDVNQLSANDSRRVEKVVKGLKIEVTHRGKMRRKYRLGGIANATSDSHRFEVELEDGTKEETNVTSYFKERYSIELRYPHLPLVKVGGGKNSTFLPLEVCKVVGGERFNKKLSPSQTSAMIKMTAQKPFDRVGSIERKFKERDYAHDPLALSFGIEVDENLMELKGRVLPPPRILFRQEEVVHSDMGAWNSMNVKFFRSDALERWGVLVLESRCRQNEVEAFLSVLVRGASEGGFQINPRPEIVMAAARQQRVNYEDAIMRAVNSVERAFKGSCQMLLVILPFQDSSAYSEIKRVCDTVVDVPSQCMLSKHVQKKSPMYCRNILLKINVKMGGVNSVIEVSPSSEFLFKRPAMVFGADVSHAAPGSSQLSFSALVGSMDAYPYRFKTQVRAQGARQEMIADLKNMSKSLLVSFYQATGGKKPEKILFYRDGVSTGQYEQVLQYELNALREACASLEVGYTPTITFVICAKRHHARFFCKNRGDSDRSGNVPPGTIVDSVVVHPRQFDFYLVSHSGIQGTSRPCHYHVIWDENMFTPDLLQELTYRQCYLFARCQRSVSLVPAVYYAHLAAFRARHHSKADEWDSVSSDNSSSVNLPIVKERNSDIMYFM